MTIFNLLSDIKDIKTNTKYEKIKILIDGYYANAKFLLFIELSIIAVIYYYLFYINNFIVPILKYLIFTILLLFPLYILFKHIIFGYKNLEKFGIDEKLFHKTFINNIKSNDYNILYGEYKFPFEKHIKYNKPSDIFNDPIYSSLKCNVYHHR